MENKENLNDKRTRWDIYVPFGIKKAFIETCRKIGIVPSRRIRQLLEEDMKYLKDRFNLKE